MAEGGETEPSQNLVCPLCLDTFKDAKLLSCGHTFCCKCLERYDNCHLHEVDHLVCPICRKPTKFSQGRVRGLPSSVTVSALDELRNTAAGFTAPCEVHPNCTSCDTQRDVSAFCHDCDRCMCEDCHDGHKRMKQMFEGHHIVSMQDVSSGKEKIGKQLEKCPIHDQNRDIFCENCKVHICRMCIVTHREHTIRNRDDFEKQMQQKVTCLVKCSTDKKDHIEKNIHSMEVQGCELKSTIEKLKAKIHQASDKKCKQIRRKEKSLLQEVEKFQKLLVEKLDDSKASQRQMLSDIESAVTLLTKEHVDNLEGDSLDTHNHLCDKLKELLKEEVDDGLADHFMNTVRRSQFLPAEDGVLDVGKVVLETLALNVVKRCSGNGSGAS